MMSGYSHVDLSKLPLDSPGHENLYCHLSVFSATEQTRLVQPIKLALGDAHV